MSRFALIFAVGCTQVLSPENAQIQAEHDLSDLTHEEGDFVGVTVNENGRRFVLHELAGLMRLDGTVVADEVMLQRDGVDLRPYTDVASMGEGRFAVTVWNDGLLLDVPQQVTQQHFCYLPGGELDGGGGPSVSQLTLGVAYDPVADVLYAQPQTFEDDVVVGSQVGTYSGLSGGQPEAWFELKNEGFKASAMAWDGDRLLLATGDLLQTYTLGDKKPEPYVTLSGLVSDVQGMAIDGDTLVLLDGERVVELDGWRPAR